MWDEIRKWLVNGGVIPHDEDLKSELIAADYAFDNKDRIQLEKKEDVKEKLPLGNSPDCADALALTFAMPVSALSQEENQYGRDQDKKRNNYDPLGRR